MKLSEIDWGRFWKNEWDKTPSPGLRNWWLWVLFVIIYYLSLQLGNWLWETNSPALSPDFNPGSNPPWYFIRRDFFQGVGCFAGFIVMLGFLVFTWRRYRPANVPILAITCIQMIPGIFKSVAIYSRCTNFFDYSRAICYWPNFNAYRISSVHFNFIGLLVAVGLAVIVAMLNWKQLWAWRKANQEAR